MKIKLVAMLIILSMISTGCNQFPKKQLRSSTNGTVFMYYNGIRYELTCHLVNSSQIEKQIGHIDVDDAVTALKVFKINGINTDEYIAIKTDKGYAELKISK